MHKALIVATKMAQKSALYLFYLIHSTKGVSFPCFWPTNKQLYYALADNRTPPPPSFLAYHKSVLGIFLTISLARRHSFGPEPAPATSAFS